MWLLNTSGTPLVAAVPSSVDLSGREGGWEGGEEGRVVDHRI